MLNIMCNYFRAKRIHTTSPKRAIPSISAHAIIMDVRTSPDACGLRALPSIAALAIRPIPYAAPIVTSAAPNPAARYAKFAASAIIITSLGADGHSSQVDYNTQTIVVYYL
jgi:hypothetical protein